MNKTLKWILIGLAIALGVFMIAMPVLYMARNAGGIADSGRGMIPFQGMMPFRGDYHMPFRSGLLMMPLMGLFGLFHLALPLTVVGLAVYGVLALVRGRKTVVATTVPPVPVVPAAEHNCTSCGKSLHNEGEFCPFCGARQ